MKNLKALFLIIVPVLMAACSNGNQNQNRNNDDDQNKNDHNRDNNMNRSKSGSDTVSSGSFLISFSRAIDQDNDKDFVKEAASSSLMEIELGRFAQENASNPRVKKFGEMMVRDHTKASEELKAIASAKNIEVPSDMDDKHQGMVDDVRDEKGDDFDKAYIKAMATAHEKDINLFQKQSDDGSDASLKAFASKTLPLLMMHRDSVKAIEKDLK